MYTNGEAMPIFNHSRQGNPSFFSIESLEVALNDDTSWEPCREFQLSSSFLSHFMAECLVTSQLLCFSVPSGALLSPSCPLLVLLGSLGSLGNEQKSKVVENFGTSFRSIWASVQDLPPQ